MRGNLSGHLRTTLHLDAKQGGATRAAGRLQAHDLTLRFSRSCQQSPRRSERAGLGGRSVRCRVRVQVLASLTPRCRPVSAFFTARRSSGSGLALTGAEGVSRRASTTTAARLCCCWALRGACSMPPSGRRAHQLHVSNFLTFSRGGPPRSIWRVARRGVRCRQSVNNRTLYSAVRGA
jgi:hypothetical protein